MVNQHKVLVCIAVSIDQDKRRQVSLHAYALQPDGSHMLSPAPNSTVLVNYMVIQHVNDCPVWMMESVF